MKIGIACDLRSGQDRVPDLPGDMSEEYDSEAPCGVLGSSCTGSDPRRPALCLAKALSTRVAARHGAATAPFCLIETADATELLTFPLVPAIATLKVGTTEIARCQATDQPSVHSIRGKRNYRREAGCHAPPRLFSPCHRGG